MEGGPPSWSGPEGRRDGLLSLPGFDPRTVQPVNQSLFQLSCPPVIYISYFVTGWSYNTEKVIHSSVHLLTGWDYNDVWAKLIGFANFGDEKAHWVSGAVDVVRRRTYTPRQSRLKPIAIYGAVWDPTVRGRCEKAGCMSNVMSDTLLCIAVCAL
jgi:hypothetical protein